MLQKRYIAEAIILVIYYGTIFVLVILAGEYFTHLPFVLLKISTFLASLIWLWSVFSKRGFKFSAISSYLLAVLTILSLYALGLLRILSTTHPTDLIYDVVTVFLMLDLGNYFRKSK